MVKQYMVPMFALVTAETEFAADAAVTALQGAAQKHGFSLLQDELVHPKCFDADEHEIHSILDLVPISELRDPYQTHAATVVESGG